MRVLWATAIGTCLLVLPSISQDRPGTVTGKVQDITGAGISGTTAELRSDRGRAFKSRSDDSGLYTFSGITPDNYTLSMFRSGFVSLTVKSIHISDGEQKSMPVLELTVGGMCWSDHSTPLPEYYRLLPSGTRVGNLAGSVGVQPSPTLSKSRPLAGAEVSLICAEGAVCGKTKTDSKGEFVFVGLSPGTFSVRVNGAGFYPWKESGYKVREGLETSWSLYVESCPHANCDPKLRPQKPLAICE
jgi:Carboxypeptidase regulatory-like domain